MRLASLVHDNLDVKIWPAQVHGDEDVTHLATTVVMTSMSIFISSKVRQNQA